jgi:hypothetical protein
LGEAPEPTQPKAEKKLKGGAKATKGAPAKGKATAKRAPPFAFAPLPFRLLAKSEERAMRLVERAAPDC